MEQIQILEQALNKLKQQTNIVASDISERADGDFDASVKLDDIKKRFLVEIKTNLKEQNLGSVFYQFLKAKEKNHSTLLVLDYVNEKLGEKLKKEEINFLDTAGNAHLKHKGYHIYISGNKSEQKKMKPIGRAFSPTGLKVIFALLVDPILITKTYREIAKQANVSLGSVGDIFEDLIEHDFLFEGISKGKKKWNLERFNTLIDKWAEAYPKLRQKNELGKYTTHSNIDWWKDVDITKYGALFGGEIAAYYETKYLKPEDGLVYIDEENKNNFIKDLKLFTLKREALDRQTTIEIVSKFWSEDLSSFFYKNRTNPLITYADLLYSADVRNIETADPIRKEFIRETAKNIKESSLAISAE
jgi:hypothetical protein